VEVAVGGSGSGFKSATNGWAAIGEGDGQDKGSMVAELGAVDCGLHALKAAAEAGAHAQRGRP